MMLWLPPGLVPFCSVHDFCDSCQKVVACLARWGYDADSTLSLGMPVKVQKTLGQVWHPWYADLLHAAGLQGTHFN